jgi:hypothetical protein
MRVLGCMYCIDMSDTVFFLAGLLLVGSLCIIGHGIVWRFGNSMDFLYIFAVSSYSCLVTLLSAASSSNLTISEKGVSF